IAGLNNQSDLFNRKLAQVVESLKTPHAAPDEASDTGAQKQGLRPDLQHLPLLLDDKTYNTSHPDYDANVVRNFPGRILNADQRCTNPVYGMLKELAESDNVPDGLWASILAQAFAEAKTVPDAQEVFDRRAHIE